MREATRRASTVLLAFIAAVTLFVAYSIGNIATATHQPADKVQATGSDVDEITGEEPILTETMRVSSPVDLILQVTTECSIITELSTGGTSADTANAFGSVRLYVTLDGTPVPVASDDTGAAPEGEDDTNDNDDTIGEVTFCNRAYGRSVEDTEGDGDVDREDDYIRTRTANAFNWFALDAGGDYYDKDNDNLLTVKVWADYDVATSGPEAVAKAFVGSRTLIIEPVHSQNDQQVGPGPAEGSPSPAPSPSCTTNGNGNGGCRP